MYVYLVAWTGGYEPPQYEMEGTEAAAIKLAKEWTEVSDQDPESSDNIDILRIDLRSPLKVAIRKNLAVKSEWDD